MTCKNFKSSLDHLVMLAQSGQGWKSYAWARAQELDTEESGLYRGMAAALTDEMNRNKEEK